MFVAVFFGYNQYWPDGLMVFVVLCPGAHKGSEDRAQLKVSSDRPSLQCYSVLSDILVKNELCIPLERGPNVLSTGEGFICLSPPSKLKIAVLFCSIYRKTISFSTIVF